LGTNTKRLLGRVAARLQVVSTGARFQVFCLALCALYGAVLLTSRLLALIPDVFGPLDVAALAAGALALAIALHRRPSALDAARRVDARMQTNDLFLTATLLGHAPGEFKPLVLHQAERKAEVIEPGAVVRYDLERKVASPALALVVVLAGIFLLPQLDPFGKEEGRRRIVEQRKKLESSRKATDLRMKQLTKKDPNADLSKAVAQAVKDLKQTFQQAQKARRQDNLKRLRADQAELGQMWRKTQEKKLKDTFTGSQGPQKFGSGKADKAAEWRKDLEQGKTDSLQQSLKDIQAAVDNLAKTTDAAERKALQEEIKSQLDALSDFAANECNSKSLNCAMQRALQQLAMANTAGLNQEALQALKGSLNLTEAELGQLAQAVRDLEALQNALQALQMAKRLNEAEALDGQGCQNCQGLADYIALYEELLAQQGLAGGGMPGQGQGPGDGGNQGGMGGKGQGQGGIAPEDPAAVSDFKTEISRSALTAGKILLQMKTRGVSDAGDAREDYAEQLKEVKQGVSEAILHEQVPPAYHEAIRRYFDSLDATERNDAEDEQTE